jgi:hypothetical protein
MHDWVSSTNASEVPDVLFFKAGTLILDHSEYGGCKAIWKVRTYSSIRLVFVPDLRLLVAQYLASEDPVLCQSRSYGFCVERSSTKKRLFLYSHFLWSVLLHNARTSHSFMYHQSYAINLAIGSIFKSTLRNHRNLLKKIGISNTETVYNFICFLLRLGIYL